MTERRTHSPRVQRIVKVGEAILHPDRLAAVTRLLEAEGCRLPASEVWPESFSASSRSKNLAPLRPLLELHQTAANRDLVYEIRDDMRAPLQRVVDALDQIAQTTSGEPHATVTAGEEDGTFMVNGEPVTERKLANTIKKALQQDD